MKKWFSIRDSGWLSLCFVVWTLIASTPLGIVLVLPSMLHWDINPYVMYLAIGVSELLLIVPLVVYMRLRNIPLKALLGNRVTAVQKVLGTVLGAVMSGAVMGLNQIMATLFTWWGMPPVDQSFLVPQSWGLALAGLVAVGITAGVVEEPIFRGVVLRGMGTVWDRRKAICLTALAFSLIHMDLVGAPSRFVVGVLLGMLAWRSGSIVPGVFAHAGYNGAALLLAFLSTRYFPSFTVLPGLPAMSEDLGAIVTWLVLSLPFAVLLFAFWGMFRRACRTPGWRSEPAPHATEAYASLPWWLLGLVVFAMTALTTVSQWALPWLEKMSGSLGG